MSGVVWHPRPAVLPAPHHRLVVVEASAGTGKTYFLEHRVVDLILQAGAELPQILVVTFTDGSTETIRHGPDIWRLNIKETKSRINQPKAIKSIVLDGGIYMDANPADNTYMVK